MVIKDDASDVIWATWHTIGMDEIGDWILCKHLSLNKSHEAPAAPIDRSEQCGSEKDDIAFHTENGDIRVGVDDQWLTLGQADCQRAAVDWVRRGLAVQTGKPRDLAELAQIVRREYPKKHCIICVLEYKNAVVTFETLRHEVHLGRVVEESTIEDNIREAKTLIKKWEIPVRLRISRASQTPTLSRKYMSA